MGGTVSTGVLLERERDELLESLGNLRKEMQSEVEFDSDEFAPDLFEREKTLAIIQTLERQLKDVETALHRLETGQYGICESCGEPIEPGRLEAVPAASLCVACKSKVERRL